MCGTQEEKEVANINKSFNTNSCFLKSPINGPMVITVDKSRLASYSQHTAQIKSTQLTEP